MLAKAPNNRYHHEKEVVPVGTTSQTVKKLLEVSEGPQAL